jgi:chromosome segregation ATPase
VDYFTPCPHELNRILKRANHRIQISLAERNLAKAEANLGLLGWQQADFDQETQEQVDALQNIEREQANLTNRSAELAHQLDALKVERVKIRWEYEQRRDKLTGERTKACQPMDELQRKLANARAHTPDVDRKAAQLDREQKDIEAMSTKLLVIQPQPLHVRDEILQLRDRMLQIQNERNDLRTMHARSLSEIHQLEQQISVFEKRRTEFDTSLSALQETFEAEDEKLASDEHLLTREKEKVEKSVNEMDKAKGNPYRAIGRVLADNGIAPMNQPSALSKVLSLRESIASHRGEIAQLLQKSHSINRTLLHISIALWLAIIVAVILVIGVLV